MELFSFRVSRNSQCEVITLTIGAPCFQNIIMDMKLIYGMKLIKIELWFDNVSNKK